MHCCRLAELMSTERRSTRAIVAAYIHTHCSLSTYAHSGFSVSVKQKLTLTEKILARGAQKASIRPNDNVWVRTDSLMTHDVCGPGTIGIFKKEFGKNAKVVFPFIAVLGCIA
jgi:hypothetical protein